MRVYTHKECAVVKVSLRMGSDLYMQVQPITHVKLSLINSEFNYEL